MSKDITLNSRVSLGYGKTNVSFDVKSIDQRLLMAVVAFVILAFIVKVVN